jgi:hypothetical protein
MSASLAAGIPREILAEARAICGEAADLAPLQGLSDASVVLYRGTRSVLVIKKTYRREARFYREMREALLAHGVDTPLCLFAVQLDGDAWLGLEYVPQAFPPARFPCDDAVLDALAGVHSVEVDGAEAHLALDWRDEHTRAVAAQFGARASEVEAALRDLQELRQAGPEALIWGDSNPLNWAMREDGRPVLLDWQRWGRGWRAYDLAGVIPGLGDRKAYREVAAVYRARCSARGIDAPEAAALAREARRAKAWAVVELLGLRALPASPLEKTQDDLRALFADWLVDGTPASDSG